MNRYCAKGYVKANYIEGDTIIMGTGNVPLNFIVSSGELPESEVVDAATAKVEGTEEIALVYLPEASKIIMVTAEGSSSFLGDPDSILGRINEAEKDIEELKASMRDVTVNMGVVMTSPDGTVLASPIVTREGSKFIFSVPPELSGIQYDVVIDVETSE